MILYTIISWVIPLMGLLVLISTVLGAVYLLTKTTRDLAQDEYERENSYWYKGE